MPFVPHTEDDVKEMLNTIGVPSIETLFDEIPAELRISQLVDVPSRRNEAEVAKLLAQRAQQDAGYRCYLGAGAYEHHIPAAVWEIATRGEFYSAYTPYQAEASQGTLQVLYEYQTMMANLMAMDVANASLYDGASALAEAVLMAVRANRKAKSRRVLIPRSVHPRYRKTVHTIVNNQNIELVDIHFDTKQGTVTPSMLPNDPGDFVALVIPQPNFFGTLEDVDVLTDWAHKHGAFVIAVVNPMAMALLKPPGEWGKEGANIACGEGQPLGIPMASGGPYFGFMCSKQIHVRQMPGRIVGRTVDQEGKPGFTLTLQAREQHIRRSKATSNICTNQGLMVTAATLYMALLGAEGLARVAATSHENTLKLIHKLSDITGVTPAFEGSFFHECVLHFNTSAQPILQFMLQHNIIAGYELKNDYPELANGILICVTETKNEQDLDEYAHFLRDAVESTY